MKKNIFISGGGTLGSVMPLLALWEDLRTEYHCFWVGSFRGIEKEIIKDKKIKYLAIPSGKWRKYFSLKNFLTPFLTGMGLKFSFVYCWIYRPKMIIVSGSFVSVPLVWAGWFLRIPVVVHQEDFNVGLAGRLTIPFASIVTVAFEETLKEISHKNKKWIGNPVRNIFYKVNKREAEKKWKKGDLPLVLVLGGGLGSERINKEILKIAENLKKECRIIDITGKNKKMGAGHDNYVELEFLGDELAEVMAVADIVVSRAGLSTLGELAVLKKPVILVPLANVGQVENADYFKKNEAAIVIKEKELDKLEHALRDLLRNGTKQLDLAENIKNIFPSDPNKKFIEAIKEI